MDITADATALPPAFFHDESGAVRCWVRTPDGGTVGAIVRKEILHYGFGGRFDGGDALVTFGAHRPAIEAAILRRVAGGSIEPVLLREADLKPGEPRQR